MNYIIVTNTINRPLHLVERSLRASLKQKIQPIKVVLIDQNNTPLDLSTDIVTNPLLQVQRVNNRSLSIARNSVAIPIAAEWIFFCDDDAYPCENYSEILKGIISKNILLEIIAGSILRDDNLGFYSMRHKKGGSLKYFRSTKNMMGSNIVVKVKTFLELGKFDEKFGIGSFWGSGEDTDLCWNAYFNKHEMEFFPELMVYHIPPSNESLKGGTKKAFYYGVGKGALVYKWLVKRKKLKVIYELIEMFIVPIIQAIRGIFIFKPQLIITNMASVVGRVFGLIKAMILMK